MFGRGHFVLPNMATSLNFGSGARQILIPQVLNYKCANFHAFAPMCTILPLRDWTNRQETDMRGLKTRASRQTGRQTNKQTGRQAEEKADRQTDAKRISDTDKHTLEKSEISKASQTNKGRASGH